MKRFAMALLGSLLATGPLRAEPGVGPASILIGQSVVLSGPMAENGTQYTNGIKLYFNQINAKGGIHGRQLSLVTLDDGYDPKRAEENTRILLEEKQVFALFGYAGTGSTLASLPLAEKYQAPFIAPYSGAEALRNGKSPVLFNMRSSYRDEMRKIVEHQVTIGIKNIAVAYQDDSFGKAGLKAFEEAMAHFNLKPAAIAAIDPTVLDPKPTVAQLAAARPAAVVLATAGQGSSAIVREFLKTGQPPLFFGLSAVSAKQLASELGKDATGIVIAQVVPSPWSAKNQVVRYYHDALAASKPQDAPHYASLEGYIAAMLLTEGLKRAGKDLTRAKLIEALSNLQNWDAGDYLVDFSKGKRSGSSMVDLSILRANGQFLQ